MKKEELEGQIIKDDYIEIIQTLLEIPNNRLYPILIKLMREKSKKITAKTVFCNYNNKYELYGISELSQKDNTIFRSLFYEILPAQYETVNLAPAIPQGACTSLTKLGQDTRMTSIRGAEVISDSTISLALEAAKRRKKYMLCLDTKNIDINMMTFHHLVRLQSFANNNGWLQHFDIAGMITAGRRVNGHNFAYEKIKEHISIWLRFLKYANLNGFYVQRIKIKISHIGLMEYVMKKYGIERENINSKSLDEKYNYFQANSIDLPTEIKSIHEIRSFLYQDKEGEKIYNSIKKFEETILEALKKEFIGISFSYEIDRKLGLGYFCGFCFHGFASNYENIEYALIDGGERDWISRLLSDNLELCVTSSFGSELFQNQFKDKGAFL